MVDDVVFSFFFKDAVVAGITTSRVVSVCRIGLFACSRSEFVIHEAGQMNRIPYG